VQTRNSGSTILKAECGLASGNIQYAAKTTNGPHSAKAFSKAR
jgi:hypothetical protein